MDVVDELTEFELINRECYNESNEPVYIARAAMAKRALKLILRLRSERDSAFERAAKVIDDKAQKFNKIRDPGMANHCRQLASSIRSLKGT